MRDIFAEIKARAEKEIKNNEEALEGIRFLQEKSIEVANLYMDTYELWKAYNPAQRALDIIKSSWQDTFMNNGLAALEQAEEFDVPSYRTGWERMLSNPRNLLFELSGETLKIVNNLNETAGTIEDYADAVQKTRDTIGSPISSNGVDKDKDWAEVTDPNYWHSWFWEEKFYKPAREGVVSPEIDPAYLEGYIRDYWLTMDTRAKFFTKDAPYWRLVEEGFTAYKRSGGGDAYPSTKPTKFIESTIEELTLLYKDFLKDTKKEHQTLAEQMAKLDKLQDYIGNKLKDLKNYKSSNYEEYVVVSVKSQLEQRYPRADQDKLERLAKDISEGNEIRGRVELGRTGERLRVRTTNLVRQMNLFKKGLN